MTQLGLLAATSVAIVLMAWFVAANQRWIRLVYSDEPDLRIDPSSQPVRWLATAAPRIKTLLRQLRTPHQDPGFEIARRQTLNRFLIFCVLAPAALIGLPVAALIVNLFATTEIARGGFLIGIASLSVLIGILGYWIYRLVLATIQFGNGRLGRPTEFAMSLFGVVAALAGAWFVSSTRVGP